VWVLEVIGQTKVDPKILTLALASSSLCCTPLCSLAGNRTRERPDGPRFCIRPCFGLIVISFEFLHGSYVVVAFVGAISIIVAALVLDRLTPKKRALSSSLKLSITICLLLDMIAPSAMHLLEI